MLEQDYTLQSQYIRLLIKGKGCDGFTYAIQFSPILEDDTLIVIEDKIQILLDSFTVQFVRRGTIDFIQTHHEEGFHFTNEDENLFHGKFFKELKL